MMTVTQALDAILAAYAIPNAGSLETVLYRVIGNPDEDGIPEAEWRRRCALVSGVSDACGVDLAAFGDLARHQGVVVAVLRSGREKIVLPSSPANHGRHTVAAVQQDRTNRS